MSRNIMYEIKSSSYADTVGLGKRLGQALSGGEVIELVGDLGGGKTALVRGLADGIKTTDKVQSPSFTLSRLYRGQNGIVIHHFDFHRLAEAGIVGDELVDALDDPKAVIAVEWSQVAQSVLPKDRLVINFTTIGRNSRTLIAKAGGQSSQKLIESLK